MARALSKSVKRGILKLQNVYRVSEKCTSCRPKPFITYLLDFPPGVIVNLVLQNTQNNSFFKRWELIVWGVLTGVGYFYVSLLIITNIYWKYFHVLINSLCVRESLQQTYRWLQFGVGISSLLTSLGATQHSSSSLVDTAQSYTEPIAPFTLLERL